MKCGKLISYGPKAQMKVHKRATAKTEVCGGSIDVKIDAWRSEEKYHDNQTYEDESHVRITYQCIKCQQFIPRNKIMNFPANLDELRLFIIDRVAEK